MLESWLKALWLMAFAFAAAHASSSVDDRVDAIMANFTTDDILGQMTQIVIGTILNDDLTLNVTKVKELAKLRVGSYFNSPFYDGTKGGKYGWTITEWRNITSQIQEISMAENGGHPIIYGIESVHGAIYSQNATYFGQQINAGASFNQKLVRQMGEITSRDSLASGTSWIFGPMLEISQNKLWARTFETFGEDPYLVSVMGSAMVKGMQSNDEIAACMKHFVGYSKTPTGHDKDGVTLSDFDLLNYFTPPFIAAMKAGVKSAMENYISINGVPVVANSKILRDLIRTDMGFEGFVVSDFKEVKNLHEFHRVADTEAEAVRMALTRTSLDMSMVPYDTTFIDYAKTMLKDHPEYLDRLRESARRIVKVKVEIGLYDTPVPGLKYVDQVGRQEDRDVALELARESIVLLQNNGSVLPLAASASVFLTGHSAHDIGNLCGGWTLSWQGYSGNDMFPNGVSIKQGIEKLGVTPTFFNGLNGDGSYTAADLAKAKELAAVSQYTIVAIGELPYAEKTGDIDDLALPAGQIQYVKELASTGTKVIVVLVEGRPRLLSDLPSSVHAVINAMLPCEAGGQAIAEIIYGKVNPSGRLPITYPKDQANIAIPYNHLVTTQCANGYCPMQWEFGTGLSYTTFKYEGLKLSKTTVYGADDSFTVSVTVTNSGNMKGKETVMLFLTQSYRSLSVPEVKSLKKFTKIELAPGKSKTVTFKLMEKDWSVYKPQIGQGFARQAENGDYVIAIKPETTCDPYGSSLGSDLCTRFTVQDSVVPFSLNESTVATAAQITAEAAEDEEDDIS